MANLSRLCIHTITTKPWSLEQALVKYKERGVGGVSVWQNAIEQMGPKQASQLISRSGITPVSYVRGGFFPAVDTAKREEAIENNKRLIDEAATIGAPILVLVCGADPRQSLVASRTQIQAGIQALVPHARSKGVKLAIEPLHPMYADTRSAINTLAQANDMAEAINDDHVGVAVDVYHLWWDPNLKSEIIRCGQSDNLMAFHICDWKSPTNDMLNDRGLMGEGCIPIRQISEWVEAAGFQGFIEVEIFSDYYWSRDQEVFLDRIIQAYHTIYQ